MVEVASAADALLAEGQRPTLDRVRQKIGRGSPNTLSPLLDSWYAGLGGRLGLAGAAGDAWPPAAQAAFGNLWQVATAQAEAIAQESLRKEREAALQERQAMAQARQALDQDRAALQARDAALEQGMVMLKGQLAERTLELERARKEADGAKSAAAAAQTAIGRLTMEHEAERRRLAGLVEDQLKAAKQTQELNAAAERRLLEEVDRARQATKQAQATLAAAERAAASDHKVQTEQAAQLQLQVRDLELLLASTREKLHAAETRLSEYRAADQQHGKVKARRKPAG